MNLSPAHDLLLQFGFSEERWCAAADHRAAQSEFGFAYPWSDLETHLVQAGADRMYLVGYGSLLNPVSAARTIADTPPEGHPPVVALGARRVFNYRMPDAVFHRYEEQPPKTERAALNAEPAVDGVLNGRAIEIALADLPGLRIREKAYDLRPVTCLDWLRPEIPPYTGYVLCSKTWWEGTQYIDDTLTPFPKYYDLCRAGAAMVSPEFLQLYLETTYFPDRQTTASVWETSCFRPESARSED